MKTNLKVVIPLLGTLALAGCETTTGGSGVETVTAAPALSEDQSIFVGLPQEEVRVQMGEPDEVREVDFEGEPAEQWTYRRKGPDEYSLEGARIESVPYYSLISNSVEYRDVPIPEQILVETTLVVEITFVDGEVVAIEQGIRRRKNYN